MRTAIVVVSLAAAFPAQQTVVPGNADRAAIVTTKDGLTLPAGELTVTDVIDAVATYLCRNYLYDFDVAGQARGFALQRTICFDAIGAEEFLHALLAARDLTVLPIDETRGIFQIVSLLPNQRGAHVANVPWRTPDEILRRPRFRELVMTAIELQHADAQQLANALRAQFSLQGNWQPGVPTAAPAGQRILILHGYRDQLAPLIVMLRQLDRALAPATPPLDPVLQRLLALEREVAALRAELASKR